MQNDEALEIIEDFKIKAKDSWRLFRFMGEYVTGVERLHSLEKAVTIFGSARKDARSSDYKKARATARLLAKNGWAVITGGGGGIMEAANRGASEGGGKSIGLNIILPQEKGPNTYSNIQVDHNYFFIRKVMFVKYAKAFIVFPGGYGTLDELFEVMTLIQTRRRRPSPVILIGSEYWSGIIDWIKSVLLEDKLISRKDLNIFKICDTPKEVLEAIEGKK